MLEWVVALLICASGYGVVIILNLLFAFQTAVAIPDPNKPDTRGWKLYVLFFAVPSTMAAWLWEVARKGFWYELATLTGFLTLGLLALPLYGLFGFLGGPASTRAAVSLWFTLLVSVPLAGFIRPYVKTP